MIRDVPKGSFLGKFYGLKKNLSLSEILKKTKTGDVRLGQKGQLSLL